MRISGTDNFREQRERWVSQIVFLEDGVERYILAVMAQLAAVDVEWCRAEFARFGLDVIRGHKQKLGLRVNELLDEPRARDTIHFYFFTGNPFHARLIRVRKC